MKRSILIIVLLLLIPNYSYSRTWYIKDDGSGDATSISEGIDSCAVGDTVLVAHGTYILADTIYIGSDAADSICVIGESGPLYTIIDCSGTSVGILIEGRDSSFLQISGFDIRNASYVAVGTNRCSSGPIIIENCIIHSNAGVAIGIDQSSEIVIRKNIIFSNQIGVGCYTSGNIEIVENTIAYHLSTLAIGLLLSTQYEGFIIRNNIIANNNYIVGVYEEIAVFECNNIFNNTHNLDAYIGVDGNFATDPQFCSLTPDVDGNFYLQSDSPCMPGNHPEGDACGLIGCMTTGCGVTGTEERSWGDIKKLMKSSSKSR